MKNIILATMLLMILASCKKKYNCNCTFASNPPYTSTIEIQDKKAAAENSCKAYEKVNYLVGPQPTCSLQ